MSTARRIALISDIHANAIALREVLRSIRALGVDEIVCLGDVATLGISPSESIDLLRDVGCRSITGNHEDYLLDLEAVDAHNEAPIIAQTIDWCREQLSSEQLAYLSSFEDGIELALDDFHRLKLFHGSPSSNVVDLLADTAPDTFDGQLGSERTTVMAGGHTHLQMLRQHRGTLVVNPGSVGAPFREFANGRAPTILGHAEYASVEVRDGEVSIHLHRVPLDSRELAQAVAASDIPMKEQLAAAYR